MNTAGFESEVKNTAAGEVVSACSTWWLLAERWF